MEDKADTSSADLKRYLTTTAVLMEKRHLLVRDGQHQQLQAIDEELAQLSHCMQQLMADIPIIVSEHAILRYCERVLGMNFDHLRAAILTPEMAKQIRCLGDGVYPLVIDGVVVARLQVRHNVIVTIKEPWHEKRQMQRGDAT